jgi:hypothetical protein
MRPLGITCRHGWWSTSGVRGCKCASMALGLLVGLLGRSRGRLFGCFAENAATTFAQAGPLPVHAGGDPIHARDFRCAKPENIAGAKPALIVLRKCVAGRRQHCQAKSQPRYGLEIASCEQINWHSHPPGLTDVAADRQTLTAFESIHDCIDVNAKASRVSTTVTPKICIGDQRTVANPRVSQPPLHFKGHIRAHSTTCRGRAADVTGRGFWRAGPARASRPPPLRIALRPAGKPPRLALVVVLRERMIRRPELMGREHGIK